MLSQRRCVRQLLVAFHLCALRADSFATVGPIGAVKRGTHLNDLFAAEDVGDVQQHGGFLSGPSPEGEGLQRKRQKRKLAVSMAERGAPGV
ncbi:hypothetical protein GCM10008098_17190 [Rhodanobacter panaciterrae]|uniref:Secreted protein n=1 Tax=Rhodanobacter panaciterrae TaxID=490572 RepID=A0ABQ2ZVX2_9GAMM|nr:hypothetical protein GCM10008098_17190 [Rhodanobacter panaciterrae]